MDGFATVMISVDIADSLDLFINSQQRSEINLEKSLYFHAYFELFCINFIVVKTEKPKCRTYMDFITLHRLMQSARIKPACQHFK